MESVSYSESVSTMHQKYKKYKNIKDKDKDKNKDNKEIRPRISHYGQVKNETDAKKRKKKTQNAKK